MDEIKEMLKQLEELKGKVLEGKATAEQLEAAKLEVAELKKKIGDLEEKEKDNDNLKMVVKSMQAQLDSMADFAQGKIDGEKKDQSLEMQLKAYEADLKKIASGESKDTAIKMELKAVGNMIGSTYFSGNPLDFANATKFGDIRQKPLMLLPLIPSTPITGVLS